MEGWSDSGVFRWVKEKWEVFKGDGGEEECLEVENLKIGGLKQRYQGSARTNFGNSEEKEIEKVDVCDDVKNNYSLCHLFLKSEDSLLSVQERKQKKARRKFWSTAERCLLLRFIASFPVRSSREEEPRSSPYQNRSCRATEQDWR